MNATWIPARASAISFGLVCPLDGALLRLFYDYVAVSNELGKVVDAYSYLVAYPSYRYRP
jgi:hypothetical protein